MCLTLQYQATYGGGPHLLLNHLAFSIILALSLDSRNSKEKSFTPDKVENVARVVARKRETLIDPKTVGRNIRKDTDSLQNCNDDGMDNDAHNRSL